MRRHKAANDEQACLRAEAVYRDELEVPANAIDGNGHVNNVAYVQWMQDIAVRHFDAVGGMDAIHAAGGTWVVRSHKIEYLSPAFAGDRVRAETWVVDLGRVRSHRRYRFTRVSDGKLLAKGETEWVFIDADSGRPRSIPESIRRVFTLAPASAPRPQQGRFRAEAAGSPDEGLRV